MITITIGGDICPTKADVTCFVEGRSDLVFHDLIDEFIEADLSVVNLECPLADANSPIAKCGPNLRAPVAAIEAIRKAGIDVLNLANNHILDHGNAALESTLRTAKGAGIATVGAGKDRDEARRILVCPVGGVRVGILGLAEHEFSIATDSSPGANPIDLIDITRNIAAKRGSFDYLIVLLHGGNEYYKYPSPMLMQTCRFLVEQGANAVICQHSHCVGCFEEYRGCHIVYGQGNLIFDSPNPPPGWNDGIIVRLLVFEDGKSSMEFVPFVQSCGGPGVRRMTPDAANSFFKAIAERSKDIQTPGFIRKQWLEFCREKGHRYLSTVLGHGRILRRLNRHGYLVRLFYSAASMLAMQNIIRCEAHRNVLETILDDLHLNRERRTRKS
jgi:poly-gamma-glutamate synthesis protein (capsule biosynthesis protein)